MTTSVQFGRAILFKFPSDAYPANSRWIYTAYKDLSDGGFYSSKEGVAIREVKGHPNTLIAFDNIGADDRVALDHSEKPDVFISESSKAAEEDGYVVSLKTQDFSKGNQLTLADNSYNPFLLGEVPEKIFEQINSHNVLKLDDYRPPKKWLKSHIRHLPLYKAAREYLLLTPRDNKSEIDFRSRLIDKVINNEMHAFRIQNTVTGPNLSHNAKKEILKLRLKKVQDILFYQLSRLPIFKFQIGDGVNETPKSLHLAPQG